MFQLLSIVHVVLAILLIALILIQRTNTDASGAFGADGAAGVSLEKRGAEKTLYRLTLIVAGLFIASLVYPLLLSR